MLDYHVGIHIKQRRLPAGHGMEPDWKARRRSSFRRRAHPPIVNGHRLDHETYRGHCGLARQDERLRSSGVSLAVACPEILKEYR